MNQNRPFSEHDDNPEFRGDCSGELLSASDALFAMLDGQIIRGGETTWRAEVVAILAEQDGIWVQIGPARQPHRAVVMRLADATLAQSALYALEAWSALPEELRPRVIDLSPDFMCTE